MSIESNSDAGMRSVAEAVAGHLVGLIPVAALGEHTITGGPPTAPLGLMLELNLKVYKFNRGEYASISSQPRVA